MNKTPNNFGGLPADYCGYGNSAIAILPVPFDKTSTWGKGADKGPQAILSASQNMELYDIDTQSEIYKKGIFTHKPVTAQNARALADKLAQIVDKLITDGKLVVTLGGEHSVSLGPIIAHKKHFKKLSVLHLDAHSDRRQSYNDDTHSHACIVARTSEHVDNIVSVGIRSLDSSELDSINHNKIFYAKDIVGRQNWAKKVVKELSENVYLTVDLDVFDPAYLPSTGTPEPGGLDWYAVVNLIKEVTAKKNIVGFDVVELAPNQYDKSSDFLAAKLVYTILSLIRI